MKAFRSHHPCPDRGAQPALFLLALTLAFACGRESTGTPRSATADSASKTTSAMPAPAHRSRVDAAETTRKGRAVLFHGACDASGAVPIGASQFAMADDEDNWLRIYDAERGGEPLTRFDLSAVVFPQGTDADQAGAATSGRPKKAKPDKKPKEMDLEAATHLGDVAYWLSSHGRNKSGKRKTERLVFFATSLPRADRELSLVGQPYRDLLEALTQDQRLREYALLAAAERAPKADHGLNIEGLTATPENTLLLGFRNPVPRGRALLVPIDNPSAIPRGEAPRFGDPIQLDLGGLGVRGLSWWRGNYLIVAGPPDAGVSRLFSWRGPGQQPVALDIDLSGFNPEGFFTPEQRDHVMLLSDDGAVPIGGIECKRSAPEAKRFRGLWLKPIPSMSSLSASAPREPVDSGETALDALPRSPTGR